MTVQECIELAGRHDRHLLLFALAVPLLAFLMNLPLGRAGGNRAPWSYLNSLLIYAVCIPGMGAVVITFYQLFFRHHNLLTLPMAVYYGPILCMVATLAMIGRAADITALPGFGRLAGLMTLCGAAFTLILIIDRMQFMVIFGGSIFALVLIFVFIFALLKWAVHALTRRGDDPARPAPSFPLDDLRKSGGLFG